jgi:hypothetical protein
MKAIDIEQTYGRTVPPPRYISGWTLTKMLEVPLAVPLPLRIHLPIRFEALYCITPDGVWKVDE